jgi:hypothetical protein
MKRLYQNEVVYMKKIVFLLLVLALTLSGCGERKISENNDSEINTSINTSLPDDELPLNESINSTADNETNETVGVLGSCEDSDGGKEYDEWGYITINDTKEYLDACISDGFLREYYCGEDYPGNLEFEVYGCEELCSNGECIEIEDEPEDNETNATE